MSSIEIIGGIKAENVAVKSEKDTHEDEDNVVEICAEDIRDDIKREPEEKEEEGDRESKVINWRITNREGDHIKTELDKQVRQEGKKGTKPSHVVDLQEKLIINYIDDDLPNKNRQYALPESKSHKNSDGNGNTLKVKPRKRRKRGDPLFKLAIKKSEYSLLKNVGKYRCNYCQTLVTSREDVYKHIRQFHRHANGFDNKEDKLKRLVEKGTTRYFPWYEYKLEGEDGYRCSHCKELIKGRKCDIERHIIENHRIHKEKKYFQCPHCPYRTLYKLNDHIILAHTDVKDIEYFRCDKCDFKAKLKVALKYHILSVHVDMMYTCPQCSKMFKAMHLLGAHKKRIHSAYSVERLKCFHCAFECKSKDAIRHHIETRHTKVEALESLQCPHCPYETNHKQRLHAHVKRRHRSRRVLQCHICSYQCTVKTAFDLHLVGHKTEKNEKDLKYRCDKCDYRTHRAYSLKVHKLNHLKPEEIQYFYCYHCDFKAKRKDNLKTHVLRHFKQDDVLFQCYICDFTTKKRLILVRHLDGHSRKLKKEVSNVTTVKQDVLVDYEDELLKEAAREKKEEVEDGTVTDTVLPIRRSQRRKRKSKI